MDLKPISFIKAGESHAHRSGFGVFAVNESGWF
jgi:hypothetical protein